MNLSTHLYPLSMYAPGKTGASPHLFIELCIRKGTAIHLPFCLPLTLQLGDWLTVAEGFVLSTSVICKITSVNRAETMAKISS
jgi:hypothetical protein